MKANIKLFAFPLSGFFLLASILCCCLPSTSHAEAAKISSQPSHHADEHCHTPASQGTDESHHADCDCGHKRLLAVNSQVSLDLQSFPLSQWHILKDIPIFLFRIYQSQTNTALYQTHSPPSLLAQSTPLFIKNSILRI